jgi:hypothetical protein
VELAAFAARINPRGKLVEQFSIKASASEFAS